MRAARGALDGIASDCFRRPGASFGRCLDLASQRAERCSNEFEKEFATNPAPLIVNRIESRAISSNELTRVSRIPMQISCRSRRFGRGSRISRHELQISFERLRCNGKRGREGSKLTRAFRCFFTSYRGKLNVKIKYHCTCYS